MVTGDIGGDQTMVGRLAAWALVAASLPSAAWAGAKGAAVDLAEEASAIAPGNYVWGSDSGTTDLVSIVVSIPDQRAYVYRGATLIAASSVSTGREGHETPVGSFSILQKAVRHHSNKYDDAPMPYMQRLTWDGIAIHAGVTPGHPASHGCVRVPLAFAKRLYAETQLGAAVTITDMPVIDPAVATPPDDPLPAPATADPMETTPPAG